MEYSTVTLSSFHKIKGENILTTEDVATWNPVANGAITFCKEPLQSGVPVIFEIEGTGHISLGIIHINPQNLKDRPLYKLQDIPEYIAINEIKVNKQICSIRTTLEPGRERVVINFRGRIFTQTIRPLSDVWLTVYIKFGQVTLRLASEAAVNYAPILSELLGMNLEFCTNGKNEVRTVSSNPAAICFLSKPLDIGQKISFFCEPLTDARGESARQFYLKIKIINKDPRHLQQQYPYLFTVTSTKRSEPNWVCSISMEMKECNGQLSIERSVDSITFSNAMNERTRENKYTDHSSELWVALELYRVSVRRIVYCTFRINIVSDDAEYATPNDVMDYVTPDNAVDYLTPDNSVDYLTPDNSVDYLTPALVGKLKLDEQNKPKDTLSPPKPHRSRGKGLSRPSYAIIYGNDSDEGASCKPLTESKSADSEDNVRFEASFNGHFAELVSDLSAPELCDHLLSLKLITAGEYDTISSKNTSCSKNRKLLRLLSTRPIPKLLFEAALKQTGNGHLVPKFFR